MHHQRLTAWIALWAFVLGLVMPSMAQWFATSRGAQSVWTEVCTSTGSKWVAIKGVVSKDPSQSNSEQDSPARTHAHRDCALCLNHLQALAITPEPLPTFAVSTQQTAPPAGLIAQWRSRPEWSPLSARAPPNFS